MECSCFAVTLLLGWLLSYFLAGRSGDVIERRLSTS